MEDQKLTVQQNSPHNDIDFVQGNGKMQHNLALAL